LSALTDPLTDTASLKVSVLAGATWTGTLPELPYRHRLASPVQNILRCHRTKQETKAKNAQCA